MSFGYVVNLVQSSVFELLIISAPLLLIGMGVGLIISIFQATTQIQEQTLTFVPKIAATLAALIIFGPWIYSSMAQFTVTLFNSIPNLAK
jgi:flagellar biosynthesis protein FliQ